MLSLSKKTDYALLALSYLAHLEPNRSANTKEIAEKFAIPLELLAKVLQKMARSQMILSTAGPNGGYRLARPAADISVGAIIEAVEGMPAIIQCMKISDNGCDQLNRCTIRKPLARINERILQMLSLITLAEIADDNDISSLPIIRQLPVRARQVEASPLIAGKEPDSLISVSLI